MVTLTCFVVVFKSESVILAVIVKVPAVVKVKETVAPVSVCPSLVVQEMLSEIVPSFTSVAVAVKDRAIFTEPEVGAEVKFRVGQGFGVADGTLVVGVAVLAVPTTISTYIELPSTKKFWLRSLRKIQ